MKKSRPRRKGTVEHASALVEPLFRWLNLEAPARGFRAQKAFALAAGPRIAARARAERVAGATLYVRVHSSAWAQELHALKAPLLEKLRRTPGGEEIADIRFGVGPLDELPAWPATAPGPAAAPPVPAATEGAPSESPAVALPLDAPAPVVDALAHVHDPELRAALTHALAGSLGPR